MRVLRGSPEAFAKALEDVFDEGGFGEALQSDTGIAPAQASLVALTRGLARALFCLEIIAQAQLKEGVKLPDW